MEQIKHYIDIVATIMEGVGVLIIFIGSLVAIYKFLRTYAKPATSGNAYTTLRHEVGKAILLGLEILIAADIMYTIVTEPTLESVMILGLIVLIRTFLSLSLQVELEGVFPWQKNKVDSTQDEPLN